MPEHSDIPSNPPPEPMGPPELRHPSAGRPLPVSSGSDLPSVVDLGSKTAAGCDAMGSTAANSPNPTRGDPRTASPLLWIALFVVFYLLPVLALHQGISVYIHNSWQEERDRMTRFYLRDLNSKRQRFTSQAVLLDIIRDRIPEFRRHLANPKILGQLASSLCEDIGASSTIMVWDGRGHNLLFHGPAETASKAFNLGQVIQEGHSLLADSLDVQGNDETVAFLHRHAERLDGLRVLTGPQFPWLTLMSAPGQITPSDDPKLGACIFWSFLANDIRTPSGMAVIIPRHFISETYGLDKTIENDPSSTPENAIGYFHLEQMDRICLSYPPLQRIANSFIQLYRRNLLSFLQDEDWALGVTPLSPGSPVRVFVLFSLARITKAEAADMSSANLGLGALLILGLLFFFTAWNHQRTQGLSLRFKMISLSLLSVGLPISLLLLIGLHYSIDRPRILADRAQNHLREELRVLDESASEFYRNKASWLAGLHKLPGISQEDPASLKRTFLDLYKARKLLRVYLVDASGTIRYDQDHLFGEFGRKAFVSELGRRALQFARLAPGDDQCDNPSRDTFGRNLLLQVAHASGELHSIVWPGSGESVYIFLNLIPPMVEEGRSFPARAFIVTQSKALLDEEYLKLAVTAPHRRDSELRFFAIDREDPTNTIPDLKPAFQAQLFPLITAAQVREISDPELIVMDDREYLTTVVPGKTLNRFYLGAHMDWKEFTSSSRLIKWFVFGAILLSLSGSLMAILILTRAFLGPIGVLSDGTRAIAGGDLSRLLPVTDRDELGDLSLAFNDMTSRLRNRLRELTVLYELAQKASTSHSLREVFELVADQLRNHLQASTCGTGWINEGEGADNLYLGEAHDQELSHHARLALVKALRQRTMVRESIPDGKRHLLAVPLCYEEKDFGGIYLVFERPIPSFSLDESSFIEMLRRQLSLIIENKRLFEQAVTDGLTRLFVRRFFMASLDKELSRSRRYSMDLSLLLLDIDHFKQFNDSYGHQIGDMVLRETSQRILESIRTTDTPGRYGGEELAVFLPQTKLQDALVVAERMRSTIAQAAYPHQDKQLYVTVSIGLVSLDGRALSIEEFITEADQALYRAKNAGRNRVEVAQES